MLLDYMHITSIRCICRNSGSKLPRGALIRMVVPDFKLHMLLAQRWNSGFGQRGSHVRLQSQGHYACSGMQRWSHCYMGFYDAANRKDV